MPPIPHRITVRSHQGSSLEDVENETKWGSGHQHRVGFRNDQNRVPGLTHSGDEGEEDSDLSKAIDAKESYVKYADPVEEAEEGKKLVNFRDLINSQVDLHPRRPDVHSQGWRYVLAAREDWVKNVEEWPANLEKKKQKEEEKKEKKKHEEEEQKKPGEQDMETIKENKDEKDDSKVKEEHEWKRESGENKHHDADSGIDADAEDSGRDEHEKSGCENLWEKYSQQEVALLHSFQQEKDYIKYLKQNDGTGNSPILHGDPLVSIDEADQYSPDNWIPRSQRLIRLTGNVCTTSQFLGTLVRLIQNSILSMLSQNFHACSKLV